MNTEYYLQAKRASLFSAFVNALLALLKLGIGKIAHSHALFADGVHSLSDVLSDMFVLLATRFGSRQADDDHPYGHARIETLAAVGVALMVTLAGIGIVVEAVLHYLEGGEHVNLPGQLTLWVAALSVIVNEGLFQYMMRVGKRIDSPLLRTNAWHNRSDAASSLVVFVALVGSYLGFPYLDMFAACLVGCLIIKMGIWDLGWTGICELVDTGLSEEELILLRNVILAVPGVLSVHQLRTRSMGGRVFLDVHVLVDPHLSVSEGHYIGEQVQSQLINQVKSVTDVTVHVDPEDDEFDEPNRNLPSRQHVLRELKVCWQSLPGYAQARVNLHYLGGNLHVEVCLPYASLDGKIEQIKNKYHEEATRCALIDKLSILIIL